MPGFMRDTGLSTKLIGSNQHGGHSTRDSAVNLISQRETFFGETSKGETEALSERMVPDMIAKSRAGTHAHTAATGPPWRYNLCGMCNIATDRRAFV